MDFLKCEAGLDCCQSEAESKEMQMKRRLKHLKGMEIRPGKYDPGEDDRHLDVSNADEVSELRNRGANWTPRAFASPASHRRLVDHISNMGLVDNRPKDILLNGKPLHSYVSGVLDDDRVRSGVCQDGRSSSRHKNRHIYQWHVSSSCFE